MWIDVLTHGVAALVGGGIVLFAILRFIGLIDSGSEGSNS